MGNRACVVFTNDNESEIGPAVYLHWNGGPESIYAFLDELERRKARRDVSYTTARFIHVVGDFMDQNEAGGLSLGVMNGPTEITPAAMGPLARMADDNGVFVVYHGKERRVRRYRECEEFTREDVKAEREKAYRHANNTGDDTIAACFLKLRPEIEW